MARYHISPESGEPKKCSAKIQCKFANHNNGEGVTHYPNKAAAMEAYAENLAKHNNTFKPMTKTDGNGGKPPKKPQTAVASDYPNHEDNGFPEGGITDREMIDMVVQSSGLENEDDIQSYRDQLELNCSITRKLEKEGATLRQMSKGGNVSIIDFEPEKEEGYLFKLEGYHGKSITITPYKKGEKSLDAISSDTDTSILVFGNTEEERAAIVQRVKDMDSNYNNKPLRMNKIENLGEKMKTKKFDNADFAIHTYALTQNAESDREKAMILKDELTRIRRKSTPPATDTKAREVFNDNLGRLVQSIKTANPYNQQTMVGDYVIEAERDVYEMDKPEGDAVRVHIRSKMYNTEFNTPTIVANQNYDNGKLKEGEPFHVQTTAFGTKSTSEFREYAANLRKASYVADNLKKASETAEGPVFRRRALKLAERRNFDVAPSRYQDRYVKVVADKVITNKQGDKFYCKSYNVDGIKFDILANVETPDKTSIHFDTYPNGHSPAIVKNTQWSGSKEKEGSFSVNTIAVGSLSPEATRDFADRMDLEADVADALPRIREEFIKEKSGRRK